MFEYDFSVNQGNIARRAYIDAFPAFYTSLVDDKSFSYDVPVRLVDEISFLSGFVLLGQFVLFVLYFIDYFFYAHFRLFKRTFNIKLRNGKS